MTGPEIQIQADADWRTDWREFPWWLVAIFAFLGLMALLIFTQPNYKEAFLFIKNGLRITIYTTLTSFAIALVLGLLAGLGRISHNTAIRNIAITYIEFIRGVPTLVLIFTLAFVLVPALVDILGIDNKIISQNS